MSPSSTFPYVPLQSSSSDDTNVMKFASDKRLGLVDVGDMWL